MDVYGATCGIRFEFLCHHDVIRQMNRATAGVSGVENGIGGIGQIMFSQRFADIDLTRRKEGVCHPAANDQVINFGNKIVENIQF